MATIKLTKGELTISRSPIYTHSGTASFLQVIGVGSIGLGVLTGLFYSNQGGFLSILIFSAIGCISGGIHIGLGSIVTYLYQQKETHYECVVKELEGTIDDIAVRVTNPIKISEPIKIEEPIKLADPIKISDPITIGNAITIGEPVKIDGIVAADLKKISIPKPQAKPQPKPQPKE